MDRISKSLAIFIILIMAVSSLSLLMVKPAFAQTSALSVPIFTLKVVYQTYTVGGVTSTDPYTGQNVTSPIYHLENDTIAITITNQQNQVNIYYDVRLKGHFEENWTELYPYSNTYEVPPQASSSNYTLISIPQDYPAGGQVDFQVQALTGYITTVSYLPPGDHDIPFGTTQAFTATSESGWSNTQTITIPETSTSSNTSPTSTPTVPEFPILAIVPLLLSVFSIAVILGHPNTKEACELIEDGFTFVTG